MLILSRVCAEFTDKSGAVIHKITPAMLGLFHDAPEALKGDLLFNMLLADGSIKTPEDAKKDRELEQDPMKGASPDGKDRIPEKEIEYEPDPAVKAEKGAKTGKTAKAEKTGAESEPRAETKPVETEKK